MKRIFFIEDLVVICNILVELRKVLNCMMPNDYNPPFSQRTTTVDYMHRLTEAII